MPLTAQQLARQRERAERDLSGLCEIHRYTETRNPYGETIKTWLPVATGVKCRVTSVGAVTGRERLRLEAIAQVTQWVLVLPADTDVTSKDRAYVLSLRDLQLLDTVRVFEVSQVLAPSTDEIRRRAIADEVS